MNRLMASALAVLALIGATTATVRASELSAVSDPLVNRIWAETSADTGLPGPMIALFSDGTLLMDSCWETYVLHKWTRISADTLVWHEDGSTIPVKVKSVSDTELVLQLMLGSEVVEKRYAPAEVPFICPAMER